MRLRRTPHGPLLILACSDGAGSAPFADVGSSLACRGIIRQVTMTMATLPLSAVTRDTVLDWIKDIQADLDRAALEHGTWRHDLACTLLLALVGDDAAVFAQVGDGVIVVPHDGGFRPVFWPQSGEYANSTNFVTDDDVNFSLDFASHAGRVEEVALLTDGLQALALNLAAKTVHAPFFRPMFARLRAGRPGEGLAAGLRRFLDSPAVNARSDDDKTLILATRVPPGATTPTH